MQKAIHGITVAHFFETYRQKLKLELVCGEAGLHRLIREGTVNRPALALTGFFKYFANKRIQVIGAAEITYLKTLAQRKQIRIFAQMVKRGIPCLVLGKRLVRWEPGGYGRDIRAARGVSVQVLTPRSIVGAIKRGYPVEIHSTAVKGPTS